MQLENKHPHRVNNKSADTTLNVVAPRTGAIINLNVL